MSLKECQTHCIAKLSCEENIILEDSQEVGVEEQSDAQALAQHYISLISPCMVLY